LATPLYRECFLRIGSNVPALIAQRRISETREVQARETGRLASGDKILRAAYDPSGLAISETMRSRSRSLQQATRNTNDGVSMLQVAEGSLSVVHDLGKRLKELALQAATDTYNDHDRSSIQKEFQALLSEVKRVTSSSEFNGNKLLNGSGRTYDLQVGIHGDAETSRMSYDLKNALATIKDLSLNSINVYSKGSAQNSIMKLDNFIESVSSGRAYLGSFQNRLTSASSNLETMDLNTQASRSKIRDADYAQSSAEKVKSEINGAASIQMLQITSKLPQNVLKLIG